MYCFDITLKGLLAKSSFEDVKVDVCAIIIILMEEGENNEGDDGQGDNFWEPSKRSKEFSNFIAGVSRKPIWETLKKDNILCTVWK